MLWKKNSAKKENIKLQLNLNKSIKKLQYETI